MSGHLLSLLGTAMTTSGNDIIGCIIAMVISLVLGVIGLVMSNMAKQSGATGGLRMAGFALSLIGVILGVICVIECLTLVVIVNPS